MPLPPTSQEPNELSSRRTPIVDRATVLVVAVVLGLTAAGGFVVSALERDYRRDGQQAAAQRAAVVLERTTASPLREVEAIARGLGQERLLTAGTFRSLALSTVAEQPLVAGIGLLKRAPVGAVGSTPRSGWLVERADVVRGPKAGSLIVQSLSLRAADPRSEAARAAELFGVSRSTRVLASRPLAVVVFTPIVGRKGAIVGALQTAYDTEALMATLQRALPSDIPFMVKMDGRPLPAVGARSAGAVSKFAAIAGQPVEIVVGLPPASVWLLISCLVIGGLSALGLGLLTHQIVRREKDAQALVVHRDGERSAAESRFSTAFDHAPIGMAVVALDGGVLQANAALASIVGLESSRVVGTRLADTLVTADRAWVFESTGMLLAGLQRVVHAERRCVHAAGHVVWTAASLTLTRDGNHEPEFLIAQFEDISERRRYEAQLRHLADHDPLTGLCNRRAFERELDRHLQRVSMEGPRGAAIVVDVDDFKHINDIQGHHAGDELIKAIARALRPRVGSMDIVARLGGDEFAVLMVDGGRAEARHLANVVLDTVREQNVVTVSGRAREITASAGIVVFDGAPGATGEKVLVDADLAMYDAKDAGRNRLAEAGSGGLDDDGTRTRLAWVDRIRDALDDGRFCLYAQPIVDLSLGTVSQYELLLRMRDEDGSVVAPGAFLPVAERGGLITRIDRWVVGEAIRLLAESGSAGPTFEVNLSGASIGDDTLLEVIERDLRDADVDPSRLVFEITETVAVADVPRAQAFAARLSALGCRFALDDFGSGFGSFYYLKHLPFDFLKIDGEFVRNCTSDETDRLIVSAAVDIARGMGKRIIAEVIEDEQTAETLRELGVDDGQGYHLGRPEPVELLLGYTLRRAG